jgi:2,4-dienoyl-CoA reductase [(3E)-enoyl-CoA-producing], peroxisomal
MSIFARDVLAGKTAIITGGGGDIGREIATVYAAHGANVTITSRSMERLEEAAGEIRAATGAKVLTAGCDVRVTESVEAAVEATIAEFGAVDLLVNAAAGNFPAPVAGLSYKGFRTVVEIDLLGTYNMTKACFKALTAAAKQHGDASIVNISATLHYNGTPFQAHVNAAKAGIDALTMTVANEWGPNHIRCNCVAPGPIAETEGMRRLTPTPELEKAAAEAVPLRRFGTKREIADACLFLSSPAAQYITGEILVVDGGSRLARPFIGGLKL